MNHTPYRMLRNSERIAQIFLSIFSGLPFRTDYLNLTGGELAHSSGLASSSNPRFGFRPMPIFANHISIIVNRSSEPKMGWVHARTIIAFMKHPKFIRYFSMLKNPSNSVSIFHVVSSTIINSNLAISVFRFLACDPIPTSRFSRRFVHLRPETIFYGFNSFHGIIVCQLGD